MEAESKVCPYKGVCKCPGYDSSDGEWVPIEGFILTADGLLCLDWDISIPVGMLDRLKPEGKHIQDAGVAADKLDDAQRKYSKSEKGKAAQRRYLESEKGKAVMARVTKSEKYRLTIQKYQMSPKGQATLLRRAEKVKDFRVVAKWLKSNPGKTVEDYYAKEDE